MKLLQFIFVNIFLLLGLAITSASTDSGETQTTVLSTSMKVIYATKTSGREVKMETREVKKPESAGHDKILIKTLAAGINRLDLIMKKRFATSNKDSMVLGLEVSGTVESIGHGCVNQFGLKVGDNVMALLSDGGYAEYVQADEGLVMPIPASIDPLEAAAIPEVWLTAYQLLFWIGGMDFPSTQSMLAAMRKEENQKSVLVHAAGSGVGIAATQLASYAGAKVFATAGTDEKLDTVQSYGAFEGWNRKSKACRGTEAGVKAYERFSTWVKAKTDHEGVDIILDCVGEDYGFENLNSLAMDSTWVSFGLLSGGNIRGSLLTILLQKRASLRATTLRSRDLTYKAALVAEFTKNILPLFDTPVADGSEARVMRPHIHSIYSFDQVTEAHQLMSDNKNTGKILLVPSFDAAAATPPPVPVSTGGYSAISRDEL